jgi:hypothetical protein
MIKPRRMRWAEHVAWEREGILTEVWIGKPKGKRSLVRSRHRWRIILKWILKGYRLDSSSSGLGPVTGCCEHGNGPLDSVNVRIP